MFFKKHNFIKKKNLILYKEALKNFLKTSLKVFKEVFKVSFFFLILIL